MPEYKPFCTDTYNINVRIAEYNKHHKPLTDKQVEKFSIAPRIADVQLYALEKGVEFDVAVKNLGSRELFATRIQVDAFVAGLFTEQDFNEFPIPLTNENQVEALREGMEYKYATYIDNGPIGKVQLRAMYAFERLGESHYELQLKLFKSPWQVIALQVIALKNGEVTNEGIREALKYYNPTPVKELESELGRQKYTTHAVGIGLQIAMLERCLDESQGDIEKCAGEGNKLPFDGYHYDIF